MGDVRSVVAQRAVDVSLVLVGCTGVGQPCEGDSGVCADLDCRAQNLRIAEHGCVVVGEFERKLYGGLRYQRGGRIAAVFNDLGVDESVYLFGRNHRLDPTASLYVDLVSGLARELV